MNPKPKYAINLEPLVPTMEAFDLGALAAAAKDPWYNQTLCLGLYAVNGAHEMMPDQLTRYRDTVAEKDGDKVARMLATLVKAGYNVTDPSLKRVPAGYASDHPRADLLRRTGLMAGRSWRPGPWLQSDEALARLRQLLKDTKPLTTWLEARVGPSKTPMGQRR